MAAINSHQKARRLIQLRLDGRLTEADAAWLDGHLRECFSCHQVSEQYGRVDAALRQDFRTARETSAAPRSLPVPAFDPRNTPQRARMNTLKSFANSLATIVLLVALTAGLAWVLNSQLRPPASGTSPDLTATPAASASSTPLPTPTPVPLPDVSSPEQIVHLLRALAQAEAAQYPASGWTHAIQQDRSGADSQTMAGAYLESWVHIDQGDCKEGWIITKDSPEGSNFNQILVFLPERVQGDLVLVRNGALLPDPAASGWLSCSHTPENTEAGRLAQRLDPTTNTEPLVKGPNELKEVKAWYENADTQPVLVVEAVFTQPESVPEVQRETYWFDLGTGMVHEWRNRMEWADGSLFGEMSRQQHIEILTELPAEAAAEYAGYAAELRSHIDPLTGELLSPTATPLPVGNNSDLDNFLYTADAPLEDPANLMSALQALRQKHLQLLAQPGWHVYTPLDTAGKELSSTYSVMLHTFPDGTCEQMSYFWQDGAILPQQIQMAGGDWGLIGTVAEGIFTQGEAGAQPCRLDTFHTVQILDGLIASQQMLLDGQLNGSRQAWVERRDGQATVVLYSDVIFTEGQPSTMNPDTKQLEIQVRSENWDYIDMETGLAEVGTAYQAYLENGKVFGEPHVPGGSITRHIVFYEALPAILAQAFEQTAASLKEYLAGLAK